VLAEGREGGAGAAGEGGEAGNGVGGAGLDGPPLLGADAAADASRAGADDPDGLDGAAAAERAAAGVGGGALGGAGAGEVAGSGHAGLQVRLVSSTRFGPAGLRELAAEHVGRLVMVPGEGEEASRPTFPPSAPSRSLSHLPLAPPLPPLLPPPPPPPGIVTHAQPPQHKAGRLALQCRECKAVTWHTPARGLESAPLPRRCEKGSAVAAGTNGGAGAAAGVEGARPCPLDPFVVLPHRSTFVDTQRLKLQDRPEAVPTGDLPRSLALLADRGLVDEAVPGMRVAALGIYSLQGSGGGGDGAGGGKKSGGEDRRVGLGHPYLRVLGLEEDVAGAARGRGGATFSPAEVASFKRFAARPGAQRKIFDLIAPQIYGCGDIKRAVACLLFGGSRKRLPDGATLRGDVNVLLLGDPSTAKSQFLKFVERAAPVAVYTSGKGSSAAGLTASVVRDPATREFYLEGGAMVLADGGVCCIDEFDKMRDEDRVAIHEAMEQQTISVAKAGITTVLNARCATLAAANPPSGKYDDLVSAQENIGLQTTVLSRFDLIFVVRDGRDAERDRRVARHVIGVHAGARGADEDAVESQRAEEAFLRRYIQYARTRVETRLAPGAAKVLCARYVAYRQEVAKATGGAHGGRAGAVPITVRQLESLVRLSEALARMTLCEVATEEHVQGALSLFDVATMDAARAGVTEHLVFTREQIAEVERVVSQVRRRVAVGGRVAERRLVGELVGLGLREDLVRRAIVHMVNATRELEFTHERRQLRRVA